MCRQRLGQHAVQSTRSPPLPIKIMQLRDWFANPYGRKFFGAYGNMPTEFRASRMSFDGLFNPFLTVTGLDLVF